MPDQNLKTTDFINVFGKFKTQSIWGGANQNFHLLEHLFTGLFLILYIMYYYIYFFVKEKATKDIFWNVFEFFFYQARDVSPAKETIYNQIDSNNLFYYIRKYRIQ